MKILFIILSLHIFLAGTITEPSSSPYKLEINFETNAKVTKYAVLYTYDTKQIQIKDVRNGQVEFNGVCSLKDRYSYCQGLVILTDKKDYGQDDIKTDLVSPNSIRIVLEERARLTVNREYGKSISSGKLNDVFFAFKQVDAKYKALWAEKVKEMNALKKEISNTTSLKAKTSKQEQLAEIESYRIFVFPVEQSREVISIINKNANSVVAFSKLYGYALNKTCPLELVKRSFSSFPIEFRASARGKLTEEAINSRSQLEKADLAEGDNAPYFTAMDINGRQVDLDQYKGQVVLVDFWASWCGPCRAEMPFLIEAKEKHKDLIVITISLDENTSKWKSAVLQDKISSFVNLIDTMAFKSKVAHAYAIRSIPQNFLIDKNGKIIAKNLHGSEIKAMLSLLQKAE